MSDFEDFDDDFDDFDEDEEKELLNKIKQSPIKINEKKTESPSFIKKKNLNNPLDFNISGRPTGNLIKPKIVYTPKVDAHEERVQEIQRLVKFEDVSCDIFSLTHAEKNDTVTSKIRGGFYTNSFNQTNENIKVGECNTDKIFVKTMQVQVPGDLNDTVIITKEEFNKFDESSKRKLVNSLEALYGVCKSQVLLNKKSGTSFYVESFLQMWVTQLSQRKLIDIQTATYNPAMFCSLHSPCISVRKGKGESKTEEVTSLYPSYSLVCVWKFLDSKTPIIVCKCPGEATTLYYQNRIAVVGTKEGTLQLFNLREEDSLFCQDNIDFTYDNDKTGIHKTFKRQNGYTELRMYVRDPSFTTNNTATSLSEIVSICHIPIHKSTTSNDSLTSKDDNILFRLAVLDMNGYISIYNAIKINKDIISSVGLRYGSTIRLNEILSLPNRLMSGIAKHMSVSAVLDNRLYCCMGLLGTITRQDLDSMTVTTKDTIMSHDSTIFNPPYDSLCEGEYISFSHLNSKLALVGWSGGWVCLYSLPDADPLNTWDISSFSLPGRPKAKTILIKKIEWSCTNENVFFVLDSSGKILIFDLHYSQLKPKYIHQESTEHISAMGVSRFDSPNCSCNLVTGFDNGEITVYVLNKELS